MVGVARERTGAIGAVVARFVHTEEVTGSNPVSPTNRKTAPDLRKRRIQGCFVWVACPLRVHQLTLSSPRAAASAGLVRGNLRRVLVGCGRLRRWPTGAS